MLCRVASQHDLADSFQLRSTEGWQNLQAILQSTGERIPKRPLERDIAPSSGTASPSASTQAHIREQGEPLAKRFAAFRLNERRTLREASLSAADAERTGTNEPSLRPPPLFPEESKKVSKELE